MPTQSTKTTTSAKPDLEQETTTATLDGHNVGSETDGIAESFLEQEQVNPLAMDSEIHFAAFMEDAATIAPTDVLPEGTMGSLKLTDRVAVRFFKEGELGLNLAAEKFRASLQELFKKAGGEEEGKGDHIPLAKGEERGTEAGKTVPGISFEFRVPGLKEEGVKAHNFTGFITADGGISHYQGKDGTTMFVVDYGSPLVSVGNHKKVGNNLDIILQTKSERYILTTFVDNPEGKAYCVLDEGDGKTVNQAAVVVQGNDQFFVGDKGVQKMKELIETFKEPELAKHLEKLGITFPGKNKGGG